MCVCSAAGLVYQPGMNETPEIQRLTRAIANLATVLIESTAAVVRAQPPPAGTIAAEALGRAGAAWMDKRDVAAHLKVSVRTVDNLIRHHRLPYIRIGRCVRFMWSDVENELKRRFKVAAHTV